MRVRDGELCVGGGGSPVEKQKREKSDPRKTDREAGTEEGGTKRKVRKSTKREENPGRMDYARKRNSCEGGLRERRREQREREGKAGDKRKSENETEVAVVGH